MPDTEKGWQQNKYNQFSQFYDYRLFRYPALLFVSPKCLNFCQSVYKHLGGGMNLQWDEIRKKVRFFLLDLFKKKFWIFSKKKLTVSSFKKWVMHGRNFVREINFTKFFRENDFTKKLPSVEFNEDETLPHSLQIYLSKRKTFLE